jgi:hypothetical protein
MYKVIEDFRDLRDNERLYKVGDEYPAKGAPEPTRNRIKELAKGENPLGRIFIEEIPAPKTERSKKN